MKLLHLVRKEIGYHKLTFLLGLLSVIVAVGVFISLLTFLHAHDIQTERILSEKEKKIEKEMKKMEDDYRKIMLKLGLNMFILPEDQKLDDFYEEGYTSKFMPEEYMDTLSASNIVEVRHMLPLVEQKIRWPEKRNRTIILIGIRGEVPFTVRAPKKPIVIAVAPGGIVLGYELWDSLNLKVGDEVKLLGETFKVSKLHPQRGTEDDITVWINLEIAQRLLGLEGRLSGIMALQCFCHSWNLEKLAKQVIPGILPGTQTILFKNEVTTRAESRFHAQVVAKASLETERQHRLKLRGELETFASWLIPFVIIASMVLIVFLTLSNLRQRRGEIATLRTLGYRSGQILYVFLAKAFFLGLIGAILGIILSFFAVMVALGVSVQEIVKLFNLPMLIVVLAAAPILTIIASWIPAILAAHEDPAAILREE
ncbi:FtsX-like permease family protein [Patescibacteria group bacterium]|nr:FtsX-like permease family protein [Patescibacteria group bacterium]